MIYNKKTILVSMFLLSYCLEVSGASLKAFSGWNDLFYSVDLNSGAATLIPSSPAFYDLDYAPDGTLYGISRLTDAVHEINPVTGNSLFVGSLTGDATGRGMTVSPDGQSIYYTINTAATNAITDLYQFNITSGSSQLLGTLDDIVGLSDIEFGPGGTLYAVSGISFGSKQLYTIDLNTLNETPIGPALFGLSIDSDSTAGAIDFAPDGTLYSVINPGLNSSHPSTPNVYISTIDPTTGLGTIDWNAPILTGDSFDIGVNNFPDGGYLSSDTLAIDPTAVPLPGALILMISGLVMVGYPGMKRNLLMKITFLD